MRWPSRYLTLTLKKENDCPRFFVPLRVILPSAEEEITNYTWDESKGTTYVSTEEEEGVSKLV